MTEILQMTFLNVQVTSRSGVRPLSEPMIFSLPSYIWITRPQCVLVTLPLISRHGWVITSLMKNMDVITFPRRWLTYIRYSCGTVYGHQYIKNSNDRSHWMQKRKKQNIIGYWTFGNIEYPANFTFIRIVYVMADTLSRRSKFISRWPSMGQNKSYTMNHLID